MLHTLRQELIYYIKNTKEVFVILTLFFVITSLIPFALPAAQGASTTDGVPIYLVALLASVLVAGHELFSRHEENGELETMQLLPWMLEMTMMGKFLAFWLLIMASLAVILPPAMLMQGQELGQWLRLWPGLSAAAMPLAALMLMAASLAGGRSRNQALLAIIVVPLMIPVLIFGGECLRQPGIWNAPLGVLISYGIFLVPCVSLAAAASIRASH